MPENDPDPKPAQGKSFARYAWTIILVVFILAFGAFTVKTFIDDHSRNNPAETTSRDQIAQEFAPESTPENDTPNNPPLNDIRGPQAPATKPKPQVLGATFKPYQNNDFGFSATVPPDAQVTVSENKVTAIGPAGIFWTLTKYENTTETLDSLETQLRSSPSVTSLAHTTLGNIPALVFTSPNLDGGTGYAFIFKNRLYYLVGNFAEPESWQGFKFF
jgi:hypothetical protein